MIDDVSDDDVYSSYEYQQYRLILDDLAAFHYARDEIVAARRRAAAVSPPPPLPSFNEWYRAYLHSPEWRERAAAVKERYGNRCALCNSAGPLEAHHRTYERVGNELPDDLIALCADCHDAYSRWRRGQP